VNSKVSIIKCDGYNREQIYSSIKKSVDLLGGIERFVGKDKKVLLKPNLLKAAGPEEAITTHPEFLRGVIRLLKQRTKNIFIGDSPGGMIKAQKVYEGCGIAGIAQEERVELVQFNSVVKKNNIPFARLVDEVDVLISLPKFKTHNLTIITSAVKNVFGLVPGLYKVFVHKQAPNHIEFAREVAKIHALVKPDLNIVDAVMAMEGEGPSVGSPRKLGLIAASADAVAVDAVLCKIIDLDPMRVYTNTEAFRLGLGNADINNIDIIGEFSEDIIVTDFKLPYVLPVYKLPNFLSKTILRLIPLMIHVDKQKCSQCLMCAEICPQKAIRKTNSGIKIDYKRCILCLCCSEMCPDNAIALRFFKRRQKGVQ